METSTKQANTEEKVQLVLMKTQDLFHKVSFWGETFCSVAFPDGYFHTPLKTRQMSNVFHKAIDAPTVYLFERTDKHAWNDARMQNQVHASDDIRSLGFATSNEKRRH